ncbi:MULTISPECIES: hypothetical protein [Chryseobacterium]|uniref:hypothetical protein n=1 Tax=Chryseobacterium TaxID=59732 RepID=UPI0016296816|nr:MULTISPECIES: hypothetical protein [Chryseobacterium]
MKKSLFILCIFIGLSYNAQKRDNKFEISFQDHFKGDLVSLRIGKCEMFKNRVLTSREIGFAGIIITFFEPNKIVLSENGNTIFEKKCNINLKKEINFHLKLNNKKEILKINLNKGKYIGLNKNEDKFELRQLTTPFEYE